jgi:catalase
MPKQTPTVAPRSKSRPSIPSRGRDPHSATKPSVVTRRSSGIETLTGALPEQQRGFEALAAAVPFNTLKASEYSGSEIAVEPQAAIPLELPNATVGASTVTEGKAGEKVGGGQPAEGLNPSNASLDRVRVDSTGQRLTTNQGVPVADNQSSLKAGLRGPTLLEDFILREKLTHFDHERIPERVVYARGSAAHGHFEWVWIAAGAAAG